MRNTLIFGNAFDGRVHVDFTKIPSAGTKFVGPLQLLAELEQKVGMASLDIDNYVRVEEWKKAIESAKTDGNIMAATHGLSALTSARRNKHNRFIPNKSD